MFQVTTQNTYVEVFRKKLFFKRTLVVKEEKKERDETGHIENIYFTR